MLRKIIKRFLRPPFKPLFLIFMLYDRLSILNANKLTLLIARGYRANSFLCFGRSFEINVSLNWDK